MDRAGFACVPLQRVTSYMAYGHIRKAYVATRRQQTYYRIRGDKLLPCRRVVVMAVGHYLYITIRGHKLLPRYGVSQIGWKPICIYMYEATICYLVGVSQLGEA